MGYTTHIYKCDKCKKEFIYTSNQIHPTVYHKCKPKPFKQMDKKDFEHMNMFLQNKDIDQATKASNFEYWKKRINGRIEYLTPLMDECIKKGIDIATLSKELHEEWIELHEHKRFYNF
jgi:DNA-directed RNA polymerase subunit RPC12/RpoP